MLSLQWLWAALVLATIFYLLKQLLWMKKRKRLPPGPKGLPILGNLHMLGKNLHQDLWEFAKKYGPIMYMRFGSVPAIIVSSPKAAENFLKTYDHVFASRPYHEGCWYFSYEQRNITLGPYGPNWRNMRKLCTLHLLSSQKISSFQPMRRQEVGLLINLLKNAACDGVPVDLTAAIWTLGANISCLMIFGKKYLENDFEDGGFKDVVRDALRASAIPNLNDYFPSLSVLDLQGLRSRFKAIAKVYDDFLQKIIDEHLQHREHKQIKDFVDILMSIVQSGECESEFDVRHVKAVLLDMLVASMDTSASTIDWTISELLRHPEVMIKLQKELQEKVGMDRPVEESDLEGLEYLNMVVKESMRLHPSAALMLPHESMEDCTVNGFHIPKKSRIIINVWAIGRDPNVWSDAESFIPERFIGSNVDLRGHNFELIPFGSGRRICPGLQLGLTIVHLLVAQLVHCFNWELADDIKPSEMDMSEVFGIVTSRAKHIKAVPIYRLFK